jgi:hypothetical protein
MPLFWFQRGVVTDEQSGHLKKRFLERFRKEGNVSQAAKGLCGRTLVYEWKKNDPEFLAAYEVAELDATEVLEHEATRRATKGVKKTKGVYYEGRMIATETEINYSDTLLIFLLKARAPEKYRDRFDVNQHVDGKVLVIDVDGVEPTTRDADG